jgi:hypothetical protein
MGGCFVLLIFCFPLGHVILMAFRTPCKKVLNELNVILSRGKGCNPLSRLSPNSAPPPDCTASVSQVLNSVAFPPRSFRLGNMRDISWSANAYRQEHPKAGHLEVCIHLTTW